MQEENTKIESGLVPIGHAAIPPSMLNQLRLCPGALKMQEGLPYESSPEAVEGTRLHGEVARAINGEEAGDWMDEEQKELVERCVAYAHQVGGEGAKFWTEVKVYVMDGEEEMTHGTCDLAIRRADGSTACIDWKFGRTPVAEIGRNYQLAAYALGCMHRFSASDCDCHIFQPRIHNATHYLFAKPDAIRSNIRHIIEECRSETLTLSAGEEQCRYCKARGKCPAFANRMRSLVANAGRAELLADPETVVRLYEAGKTVKKFLTEIEDALKGFIRQTGECGGYVLQERAGLREVSDIEGCAEALSGYLTSAEFLKCAKVSASGLVDALAGKIQAEAAGGKMTKTEAKKQAQELVEPFVRRAAPTATIAKKK